MFVNNNNFDYVLTNGPDLISKHIRSGSTWEPTTLKISKELISGFNSPVLIDIGANLGDWSIPMSAWVKDKGGKVFSFEPQRPVFYQLCANLFFNNLMNCHAYNIAIGDFSGTIDIPFLDIFSCKNLGALYLSLRK